MQITELLQRVHSGDAQALNAVIPLVYDELKKLAAGHLRREGKTRPLDTTALVHETFLRLARGRHPSYESRSHFYGIASRLMRQVLVDLARARSRAKRRATEEVSLAEIRDPGWQPDESLLVIDEALKRLAGTDPLKVQLLEMRYFGGMTAEEAATALSVSVHVVRRELRLAQAWLHKEIADEGRNREAISRTGRSAVRGAPPVP
jgi:RNA polymerase sigma-70 factor, ECF subfamily